MFILDRYIITPAFMYMVAHYDREGYVLTQVKEVNRTFFVNKSPMEIIDYSIKCIGFSLRGALESSKWLLGNDKMSPIMVNPIHRIVLFPIRSTKHDDNIWFNPIHIARTTYANGNTLVIFSNQSSLTYRIRLSSFNTKLQTAEQLKKMTIQMADGSFVMYLDPEKRGRKERK